MSAPAGPAPVPADEPLLTLRDLADSYQVELSWVQAVFDAGLLGAGSGPAAGEAGAILVAASMHGRLALIRRLHHAQGVNLAGIAVILELLET